jgi:hypothetical protein
LEHGNAIVALTVREHRFWSGEPRRNQSVEADAFKTINFLMERWPADVHEGVLPAIHSLRRGTDSPSGAVPQVVHQPLRAFHEWHIACYRGVVYDARRVAAIDVKRSQDPGQPEVVNLRQLEQIMRKKCPDADTWFAMSDD